MIYTAKLGDYISPIPPSKGTRNSYWWFSNHCTTIGENAWYCNSCVLGGCLTSLMSLCLVVQQSLRQVQWWLTWFEVVEIYLIFFDVPQVSTTSHMICCFFLSIYSTVGKKVRAKIRTQLEEICEFDHTVGRRNDFLVAISDSSSDWLYTSCWWKSIAWISTVWHNQSGWWRID